MWCWSLKCQWNILELPHLRCVETLNTNNCALNLHGSYNIFIIFTQTPLQWILVNGTTTKQVIQKHPDSYYKVAIATEKVLLMDGDPIIPVNSGMKWSTCYANLNQGKIAIIFNSNCLL